MNVGHMVGLLMLLVAVQGSQYTRVITQALSQHSQMDNTGMNDAIILQFSKQYDCEDDCSNSGSIIKSFQSYRQRWISKMIEWLVQELDLNEEAAKEAKRNPNNYYFNYDTYKLLSFK